MHNLKKLRIPEIYTCFVKNLLTGSRTKLKFNDYTSEWFNMDDVIGQGDPLSMILYLYSNVNLLDMDEGQKELALGYVDDMGLVSTMDTFSQTHAAVENMMERRGGGFEWAGGHNSRFETSELVVVDFSYYRTMVQPTLVL